MKNKPPILNTTNRIITYSNQPAAQVTIANGTTSLNLLNGSAINTPITQINATSQPGENDVLKAARPATTGDHAENGGAGDDWAAP